MPRALRSRSAGVAVIVAAVAVVAGVSVGRAQPPPELPPVSPDRLLASTLQALANRTPISGRVRAHLDLGLPELPSALGDEAGPLASVLSDGTYKYWRSPEGTRLAQLLPFAERVVVLNRTDAWAWDSDSFTAWHYPIEPSEVPPPPASGDPLLLAQKLLTIVKPYATTSVASPDVVAGRDAYVLSFAPTTQQTLVGSVRVAIDAETRLPLRLQIVPRGATAAAVEVGFTSVSLEPVDPAMFSFTPPAGATVHEVTEEGPGGGEGSEGPEGPQPDVRVFGAGFDLVIAVRVPRVPAELRPALPYAGPLASAIAVARGSETWILAGAVSPETLHAVASRLE